ncbi:oocyte-secreted protein 3-like [Echinops telfairi]|uniref:Oocyte-secreted protein 3-like n=1 Tax=Echinops telfairi TaxID=9371 RepID=A0AC55DMN5_ECHTE|nr:oocyte-secreted protein 3-like [Echinops telfairi]
MDMFLVWLQCTYFTFHVAVKRTLFSEEEILDPRELFLGSYCPATEVDEEKLIFEYPNNWCSIRSSFFTYGFILRSELRYQPRNRVNHAEILLECVVSRTHLAPDGSWFMVRRNYCDSCRATLNQDNQLPGAGGPQNHSAGQQPFGSAPEPQNRRLSDFPSYNITCF